MTANQPPEARESTKPDDVGRLRKIAESEFPQSTTMWRYLIEAADTIESLQAENERLSRIEQRLQSRIALLRSQGTAFAQCQADELETILTGVFHD